MYNIEVLNNQYKWINIYETTNIQEVDKVVWRLTNQNKYIRILKDDIVLTILNGSEYEYFIFKNKYVRERKPEYDYVKEYHKKLEKKK